MTDGPPIVATENRAPNSPENSQRSTQAERHWLDNLAVIIASIAAFAAACAAGIGAWQGLIARDNENRSLRAYVGVTVPGAPTNGPMQTGPPNSTFKLGIKNFGTTPAYRMTYVTGWGVRPYPLPKDNIYSVTDQSGAPMTVWPGPLDPLNISITADLTSDDIARTKDGKTNRLYIWGAIHYFDAFRYDHVTTFCIGFLGISGQGSMYEHCTDYNDSN
jgi:hypothetical protein